MSQMRASPSKLVTTKSFPLGVYSTTPTEAVGPRQAPARGPTGARIPDRGRAVLTADRQVEVIRGEVGEGIWRHRR